MRLILLYLSAVIWLGACTSQPAARDSTRAQSFAAPDSQPLVFSNMSYNEEGGDVLGYEVSLRRSNGTWVGTYQNAEGSPGQCDTLAIVGEPSRFTTTLKPLLDRSSEEIYPAWPMEGGVVGDTLRAIIHMRWNTGDTRTDTVRLPRVSKPYFQDCAGAA